MIFHKINDVLFGTNWYGLRIHYLPKYRTFIKYQTRVKIVKKKKKNQITHLIRLINEVVYIFIYSKNVINYLKDMKTVFPDFVYT